jgi:hypothetical protein
MIGTIILILVVAWIIGLVSDVGNLIHLLLLAALIVLAYDLLIARRRSV